MWHRRNGRLHRQLRRGPAAREVAQAMTETMACRGPDDEGLWTTRHAALGHRRLAIIDVPGGRQPMVLDDPVTGETRLAIVYSGEVYNFTELRDELAGDGHRFRTDSDTEVVLHGWLEWGEDVVDAAQRHVRVRALGRPQPTSSSSSATAWASSRSTTTRRRDGVLFGSEPKAILAHPRAEAVVDLDGHARAALPRQDPGPRRSTAACTRSVPARWSASAARACSIRRYWKLEALEHTDDRDTTVAHVRELLDDIVAAPADLRRAAVLAALRRPGLLGASPPSPRSSCATRARVRCARSRSTSSATRTPSPPTRCATPRTAPTSASSPSTSSADHEAITLSNDDLMDADARAAVLRRPGPAALARRHGHLALPAVQGDPGPVDRRALRRVRRRGVRRLPLVPRRRRRQRRHLPVDGGGLRAAVDSRAAASTRTC